MNPHLDPDHTLIILNPNSGSGRTAKRQHTLLNALHNTFGLHHVRTTKRPRHAAQIALEATQNGFQSIVSIGGDGTHSEVAAGLLKASEDGLKPPLLVPIPSGTGSDLCRLMQGGHHWEARIEALRSAQPHIIDAGRCSFAPDGASSPIQRTFINAATCGFNGLVDEYVNASTSRFPIVAFLSACVRAWARYTPPLCRVVADGKHLGDHRILTLSASNGRFVGAGMQIAPHARLNDGLLDVLIVPAAPLPTLLSVLPTVYNRTIHTHPHPTTLQARCISVEPLDEHRAYIDLDGEHPGCAPLTWEVLPKALRVLGVRPEFL